MNTTFPVPSNLGPGTAPETPSPLATSGGDTQSAACNAGTPPAPISTPNPSRITHPESRFTFHIPADQAARHANAIPHDEMQRVRTLLAGLHQIHTARKIQPACKHLSATLQRRGFGPGNIRSLYYKYTRGTPQYPAGDWRILLNKSKAKLDPSRIPDHASAKHAFIEFWRSIGERFHQDWAAAHDELLTIWRTAQDSLGKRHTTIPGYDTWPKADPWLEHPPGWSYANLMRHQSDPYDQVAARIGHAKASALRLPVLTTRVGLPFGQFIEFDDHEFNQRVLFQRKPMRPLGFGAVEVLSGSLCHIGLKPTLWDFEEAVKRKLTEREFMWFVTALLTHIGYRQDIGTTLIVERGTAAIRSDFEARLHLVSAGKLTTHVGGRFGKPAHAGQLDGRSKGNFRTKKLIEGMWAILDNQTAQLPAQTGRNRDDAPEAFAPGAGAEQYTNRLLRSAATHGRSTETTDAIISQFQFPYPEYHQWRQWALDSISRINRDPNHDLEGWEKLGYVQPTWRLPSPISDLQSSPPHWLPWQSYLALPTPQQAIVKAMLDQDPSLLKTIRLSRHDVFQQNRHLLTPMPWELLPQLVGQENALNGGQSPLTVNNGLFRFECADIDPDPIEFYARSGSAFLSNGEKYICYVNPYCPTHLVATDAAGKVAAVCPRYTRALRTDTKALNQLLGNQQSYEAQARVRLNLRHSDQAAAKANMLAHNDTVLLRAATPAPADPRLTNLEGDITQFLEPQQPAPATESSPDDLDTTALL